MSDPSAPALWAVIGATGTGKTALSLDLVEALAARGRPAEIVNADAMQLYRGMDIGTAKLPVAERRGIPHHLFDVLEPAEDAAVAWYQDAARAAVTAIHGRGADAILVGGSGLYVSSVLYDFRFPPRDPAVRARLERELDETGPGALYARLRDIDPLTAERVDPRNGRRIVRALEVLEQGEATHGAALPETPVLWHEPTRIVGVQMPRDELVARLDARVEGMWRDGLVGEVAALRAAGLEDGVTARRAIGYAQALGQLDGDLAEAEAIAQTQALTRRYARRQVSWFRRYADVTWVGPDADAAALEESPGWASPTIDRGGGAGTGLE
ncbi:tRNA (adenosine(37)-N6)-dimethylallyltransferase MiaA [Microbacterium sp. zg.Y1090]|uniref:tRNA (adenosine(37)-N6)-dimethylallyltransferase MiaA n=1 Tax=Microbacterium wangruii TaxID=3049073 RepID=UPI00214AA04F|nr:MULTISPECIES: tRNA (adenosine(37)-N6)-dimethylallyltransferase MiaA [unclassified Microbacterium]MCR2818284.1 tRNA (adenosine(37)-N6)-dimethylallyltransferase MiaA [Microbacterium sp. zg.Y1090]WIM27572.1 tRNA (adenosine(37)-N6)-dimethylallyltransferase MiaA [Microbacterium sp. zg-Y1090]